MESATALNFNWMERGAWCVNSQHQKLASGMGFGNAPPQIAYWTKLWILRCFFVSSSTLNMLPFCVMSWVEYLSDQTERMNRAVVAAVEVDPYNASCVAATPASTQRLEIDRWCKSGLRTKDATTGSYPQLCRHFARRPAFTPGRNSQVIPLIMHHCHCTNSSPAACQIFITRPQPVWLAVPCQTDLSHLQKGGWKPWSLTSGSDVTSCKGLSFGWLQMKLPSDGQCRQGWFYVKILAASS